MESFQRNEKMKRHAAAEENGALMLEKHTDESEIT